MLNLKKVIASICVLAMVLSTVAFGATYSDVAEDSAYYEAVETLNKLDIVTGYEDGTYKPEDGVTRAEMAALIARIQGYGETAKGSANTGFTDVPASHWASGYIANAAGMGIINGYGDGTFGPEDPVLYEQAVKMVMATLGYTPFAEKNGGYPTGYLAAAQRYDVSLSVANAAVGQAANRGTVAQILANAIDTPLMVQSKWNTNGEVEYVIADGKSYDYKTLMSENLGYVKVKGIVVANSLSALGEAKTIDTTEEAYISVDIADTFDTNNSAFNKYISGNKDGEIYKNVEFLVGETDAEDYLGYNVIAYLKNVNNKFELVSIAKDATTNRELTISLDQYAGTEDGKHKYFKEGDKDATLFVVESGAKGVFNGIGMSASDILGTYIGANCLFGGEITFIDNNATSGYDVVIATRASTGVVDDVSSTRINFRNEIAWNNDASSTAASIKVDKEDETKFFELTKDGEVIDFAELQEWDVLSIYAVNANSKVIKAEVIGTKVVGVIESTRSSKTSAFSNTAIKVAGNWYDVALGSTGFAGVGLGDGGTFYVDQFGKVAAFDEDSALATGVSGTYGYVIATDIEKAKFSGTKTKVDINVQILTADGVEILPLKAKTEIENGGVAGADIIVDRENAKWLAEEEVGGVVTTVLSPSEEAAAMKTAIDALEGEVVMYTKNAAGEISSFYKAAASDSKFAAVETSEIAALTWEADAARFVKTGDKVYVDSDAIVFLIGNINQSRVGTIEDLSDEGIYTIAKTYMTKKATYDDIIVITDGAFGVSPTATAAVVTGVGESTNEAGEKVYEITYLQDGVAYEGTTIDNTDPAIEAVTVGDIVKVKASADGIITAIKKYVDFADGVRDLDSLADSKATGSILDSGENQQFFGGVVASFIKDDKNIAKIGGVDYMLNQAQNVYVIDAENTLSIDNGEISDFSCYSLLYEDVDYVVVNGTTQTAIADARAYADHIYVRVYDDKVTDVIIVKGLDFDVDRYVAPVE